MLIGPLVLATLPFAVDPSGLEVAATLPESAPWWTELGVQNDQPVEPAPRRRRFSASLYYSTLEFDEVDFEDDDSGPTITIEDVERERIGFQFGFGPVFARMYHETLDGDTFAGDFEGFGAGFGAKGAFFPEPDAPTSIFIDYEGSVDFAFLEQDEFDVDLFHATLEGKFGGGVDHKGFRVSAGFAGSFTAGVLNVGDDDDDDGDADFDGFNIGAYAGLGWFPKDVPVNARLDVQFGDIEGVTFTVGYAF